MAHRAHSTDMEDEPMAEPAEEDVMRLAAVLGGGRQGVNHQRIDDARRLLAAGVTLPPEPDTPAEPQERYWVGDGESDNKVYERGRAHIYAETYLTLDASRIARLLNLDAKYEDQGGIGKALESSEEALRSVSREFGEAFAQRDEARAEVERLTAELAQEGEDWAKAMNDADDAAVKWRHRADRAERDLAKLTEDMAKLKSADPQDDGPTEPPAVDIVFDGPPGPTSGRFVEAEDMTGASVNAGEWIDRGNGLWALRIPLGQRPTDTPTSTLRDALELIANGQECTNFTGSSYCRTPGMGRQRDAYYGADRWCDTCIARDALDQAGSTTPAPVTAEMVAQGLKEIGALDLTADGCAVLAVKLNKRIGADTPSSPRPVTAEMVRQALGESGALAVAADRGLSPFDVADALNVQLGRTDSADMEEA